MAIIIWIISGIIAGWLAGMLIRAAGYGLLGDLIIGLLGGVIGGFPVGLIGIQPPSWVAQILVAVVGGVILVWILHMIHPGVVNA